jgi:hypothetical protein
MPLFLSVFRFHFLPGPSSSLSEPKIPRAAFFVISSQLPSFSRVEVAEIVVFLVHARREVFVF